MFPIRAPERFSVVADSFPVLAATLTDRHNNTRLRESPAFSQRSHDFSWRTRPGRFERRLRQRGTEDDASLQRRFAAVRQELAEADHYHYQLVNRDLDDTVAALRALWRRISNPPAPKQ